MTVLASAGALLLGVAAAIGRLYWRTGGQGSYERARDDELAIIVLSGALALVVLGARRLLQRWRGVKAHATLASALASTASVAWLYALLPSRPENYFANGGADDVIVIYGPLAVLAIPLEALFARGLAGWGPLGRFAALVAAELSLAAPVALLCGDTIAVSLGDSLCIRASWLALVLAAGGFAVRRIDWGSKQGSGERVR